MLLKNLLPQNYHFKLSLKELETVISSIEIDSRKVKENAIFFALQGKKNNGLQFIKSAIENGAKVIVCDEDQNIEKNNSFILIKVKNSHELLVFMLQKFYPNLPDNIFVVTGTNGKTSVAEFCRQIFVMLGKKAASIGTLGVTIDDLKVKEKIISNNLTTPDLVSLYQNLAILKENDIDFVTLEASSIGLEQGRMDGIKFKAGAFTNFTQDHLDYHQDMEQYFAAKMILFERILSSKSGAILNADEERFEKIKQVCERNKLEIISYGKKQSDYQIINAKNVKNLKEVELKIFGKKYIFKLALLEDFQLLNVVCALAMVNYHFNLNEKVLEDLLKKFSNLTAACGRMEQVGILKNKARIYVDFAHSPDALENILKTARNLTQGRVIVLFGCGGDRDAKKRPIMGKIARDLADLVIITDDNPRTEKSELIRREIILGIDDKSKIIEIANREEAIQKAISFLKENEVLIIAGKGHEKYQIIGDKYWPFDEKKIVEKYLIQEKI